MKSLVETKKNRKKKKGNEFPSSILSHGRAGRKPVFMVDQEEEELQMALRMSLQPSPPEAKRSKPLENAAAAPDESPEAKNRRLQRELRAAAAEKRMLAAKSSAAPAKAEKGAVTGSAAKEEAAVASSQEKRRVLTSGGDELSASYADQLFSMVFGNNVSGDILAQWSNQGIRFSSDPETSMGLVQHEGGPCGVLATLHAFVLKHLLFCPDGLFRATTNAPQNFSGKTTPQISCFTSGDFSSLTEDEKTRALVLSMVEILFSCGSKKTAVVATLNVLNRQPAGAFQNDETVAKALEGLSIESGSDLQKVLRVNLYDSTTVAFHQLKAMLPVFRSRLGAMLFLLSALLSRGLESVQSDRDDPSLPLVTAPFGHASQEIVNLLLCGRAVPNVFDGRMDLGSNMFLKGIPTNVDVGFLTLLEFLNFCKVGQYLKHPRWPIWVIGSESHYTILFALDPSVQDVNELEERENQIRRAFDAQDQSGGGGFISVEGLHQVLRETNINLPAEKLDHLQSTGFIVWSEFWQVLLDLDKSLGGFKDSTGMMGKKVFDLYHFNGIAKSVPNGSQTTGGEIPIQRPRLSKLKVTVPPKWTPEEFMANVSVPCSSSESREGKGDMEVNQPEPSQHAPLADCIRTRWPRAVCSWVGDPPSIV